MAEQLGTAVLELRADGTKLRSDMESERRGALESMDSMGRSMQRVGAGMTAAVTAPVLMIGDRLVDAASDLNESVNAVNVVFGDAAEQIHEFGETAAETAGLSQKAFNELVTPIGAMLQNLGFSADEAADSSINLAQRAADMASVFNVDVSEALGAIQAGLRGEADPLERFGVGLSAAAVEAHALSIGLAETTVDAGDLEAAQIKLERATAAQAEAVKEHGEGSLEAREATLKFQEAEEALEGALAGQTAELTDAQKGQARLSLLMEQTDAIAGDFADTSDQVANAERITAAEAENAAAALGQKLLPIKAKLVDVVGNLVDWFNELSPAQQDMIVKIGLVAAAIGPLLIVLGSAARAISAIGTAATTVGPKLWSMGQKAVAAAGKFAASAGKAIASMVRWAASVVAQGARAAASMAKTAAQFVAKYALMAAKAMANAVRMAASWVVAMGPVGWVIAGIVALVALIIANWDKVKEWTKRIWEWVGRKVESAWTWIKDATTSAVDAVVGFFSDLKDRASAIVTGIVDFVTKYHPMAILWRLAKEWVPKVISWFSDLKDRTVAKIGEMVDRVMQIKDDVIGFFTGAKDWLVDAGKDIIRGLIDGIVDFTGNAVDAIVDTVKNIKDAALGFLGISSPSTAFADEVGEPMMEGTYVGFECAGSRLAGPMSDVLSPGRFTPAMASAGVAGHTHPVLLDGHEVTDTLMPTVVDSIRTGTGL